MNEIPAAILHSSFHYAMEDHQLENQCNVSVALRLWDIEG